MAAIITQNPSDAQNVISGVPKLESKDSCVIGALAAVVVPGSRFLSDGYYKIMAFESYLGTYVATPTVVVNKNGVAVGGLSNGGYTAGGLKTSQPTVETLLNPGDRVDVEVTVHGGSSNLTNRIVLARVLG